MADMYKMGGRSKAQNRAAVAQLKLIGQMHPTGLTTSLLKLFEPRPMPEFKPPLEKRKMPPLTGIAQWVGHFAEPGDPEYSPPVTRAETREEKRQRIREAKLEKGSETVQAALQTYDPQQNPHADGDPYKTLFVARVSYETTETKVRREFEAYGPIKKVTMVTDALTGKPRGYAFIEYHHTRDMKTAYKQADGRKIDNRRVLVDVERGRTVPNWRPRRLGGGLGSTRTGGEEVNQKHSGRDPPSAASKGPAPSSAPRDETPRERPPAAREDGDDARGRDKDRERERERDYDRGRDRGEHRGRDRERERERDPDRDRDRDRERDRDRDRERERDTDRDRERERDPDRDRERDRERAGRERDAGEARPDRPRSASRDVERERDR